MKINIESTKFQRFCNLLGWLMVVVGLVLVTVIGAFSGYSNGWVLFSGFILILLGVAVSRSSSLINFLS